MKDTYSIFDKTEHIQIKYLNMFQNINKTFP